MKYLTLSKNAKLSTPFFLCLPNKLSFPHELSLSSCQGEINNEGEISNAVKHAKVLAKSRRLLQDLFHYEENTQEFDRK